MSDTAVVTLTARNLDRVLADGGSQAWRLDADRARRSEFLVCTQNRHGAGIGTPTVEHGHAFLIGRIADVVAAPERADRWLIKITDFIAVDIPNVWGKSGHLRYPVWYTTLGHLGIDLAALPPFAPLRLPTGLAEASGARLVPPREWMATRQVRHSLRAPEALPAQPARSDAWERLDAILAQLDRVRDLPQPADPLDWDEHGLPR